MKDYQIGFSDEFSYNNKAIKYEITTDGEFRTYVKDCAIAIGRTETKNRNGNITCSIQWNRVYKDLVSVGIIEEELSTNDFNYKNNIIDKTINLEDAILWASIIKTKQSKPFMMFLINIKNMYNEGFDEYIQLEKNRLYEISKRKEECLFDLLEKQLTVFDIKLIKQYRVLKYIIDGYLPELNIAIEYDENNHKNYTYEQHELRQKEIEKELGCKFIRVTDFEDHATNCSIILKNIIETYKGENYEVI